MLPKRPRERDEPTRQLRGMHSGFPGFVPAVTRSGGVVWRGALQPTTDSPHYRVVVVHEPDRSPKVAVTSPVLQSGAPHRYRDGSLCLYWKEDWHWTTRSTLAETIMPWVALWLYYYEIWVVTGEWHGPSSPHTAGPVKEAA